MSARLPHTLVLHGLTRLSVDLHLRASSSGVSAVPPVPPVAPFVFGLRAHLCSSPLDAQESLLYALLASASAPALALAFPALTRFGAP